MRSIADNYVAIRLVADDGAKPDLDELKLKLDELKGRVAEARAEVTTAEADAKLTDLEAKLEAAGKKVASPRIDLAGAARANAQITAVEAELDGLDAKAAESATVQDTAAAKGGGAWAAMGEKAKLALVGVGIGAAVAVMGASNFDAQTTRLVTSAGELTGNLTMVRQGMLGISAATATSTSEMAAGMYTVESAGFHGAQALVVLKAAAQGAKDEGAGLAVVSNAVTDALVDYHLKASQSANVTSQLIAAVSHGKTTFEDFSGSMSNILPLAASMHLRLADVTGVLAEMTAHGMSADRASQDEANAMRSLLAPTGAMTKEFKALGITSAEVHDKLGQVGLAGTMQWLSGVAQKGAGAIGQNYTEAMKKLMGTAPGLVTALMTTGENADATNKAIRGIAGASADAKGNVDGFGTVSQTAAFKMAAAKESIMAAGISLGQVLLPSVVAVLTPLTHMLQVIAGNKAESIAFAVIVGGVLAGALGIKLAGALKDASEGIKAAGEGASWLIGKIVAMTAAQEAQTAVTEAQTAATEAAAVAQDEMDVAMDANPIGLIIIAVVALIAAIVLLATHWKQVWHFILSVVDGAVKFIKDHWMLIVGILTGTELIMVVVQNWRAIQHFILSVVDDVVGWIRQHWPLLLAILTGPIGLAVLFIVDHWRQITAGASEMFRDVVSFFQQLPHRILSVLGDLGHLLWNAGAKIISGLIGGIESQFSAVGNAMSGIVGEIKNFLPFSPAKKGPLSGSGAPENSGRSIARLLARGITSGIPEAQGAMQQLAGRLAGPLRPGMPGYGGYGAAGGVQRFIFEFRGSDSKFMTALMGEVRQMGGDPTMFQRKVVFR